MDGMIVPLRPRSAGFPPLSRIDAAAELLAEGRVPNLQAARIEALLEDLRAQRGRFAAVLVGMRERGPTGRIDVDAIDAALALTIAQGIVQIDLFIARARSLPG